MSTKGASNRYGNSHDGRRGHSTSHTGFAWAKSFHASSLNRHADAHMSSLGLHSPASYEAHAVAFANRVDRENNVSYVRRNGDTVKFSKTTGELAVISKSGIVTTYFKPKSGIAYYNADRRAHK